MLDSDTDWTKAFDSCVTTVEFNADRLMVATQTKAYILDKLGKEVCVLNTGSNNDVVTADTYKDWVVTGSSDGTLRLFETSLSLTKANQVLPFAELCEHQAAITCCAFSMDGSYLATVARDKVRTVYYFF